jgi:pyruvate dehydrogenase E2 component (dihydrolipoamide acetyltransferase)
MPTEIKLPSLGEGVESGDVLEILVKVGDIIKKDQSLLEMETDKATVSVPSPLAGKLISIDVKDGQTVKVGMVLGTIEAAAGATPPAAPATKPAPQAAATAPTPPPAKVEVATPQPSAAAPAAPVSQPVPASRPAPAKLVPTVAAPIAVPRNNQPTMNTPVHPLVTTSFRLVPRSVDSLARLESN